MTVAGNPMNSRTTAAILVVTDCGAFLFAARPAEITISAMRSP